MSTIRQDPEGHEIDALLELAGPLAGKTVLEIGCGDGRLTWRYAAESAHVTAIDPNPDKIAAARIALPASLDARVNLLASSLEEFASQLGHLALQFDCILLSWSL
jgi:2-polyprenyl-3-methyl-5-hydroxy-6-metoxy-1,4-benzoquinol methylase